MTLEDLITTYNVVYAFRNGVIDVMFQMQLCFFSNSVPQCTSEHLVMLEGNTLDW